ncbi:MAG: hypothetical protein ACT4P2_03615 [Pseudomonadota bacterium]
MPEPIGGRARRQRGGFIAALGDSGARLTPIGNPDPDVRDHRFNDGK